MGANEDLSNFLDAPNGEDFWLAAMETGDGGVYSTERHWPPPGGTSSPGFVHMAAGRTVPVTTPTMTTVTMRDGGRFVEGSYGGAPCRTPADPYAYAAVSEVDCGRLASTAMHGREGHLVGSPERFGGRLLSADIMGTLPEVGGTAEMMAIDGAVLYNVAASTTRNDVVRHPFPHLSPSGPYRARDVEFEATSAVRVPSMQECESTNSSLETTVRFSDNFVSQERTGSFCGMSNPMHRPGPIRTRSLNVVSSLLELKPPESSHRASSLSEGDRVHVPMMMGLHSLPMPQMKPPNLPNLHTNCPSLQSVQFLESGWDLPVGRVLGRSISHPEPKRQECPSLQKSRSTPTITGVAPNAIGGLSCNTCIRSLCKTSGKPLVGKLTPEERQRKIIKYKQKRNLRKFDRGVTYQCRKTLADRRPRVRGRFARNNDSRATFPKNKSPPPSEVEGKDSSSSRQTAVDVATNF